MRVALTAGYDRAPNVLGTAELLRRDGHDIVGILVVSPFSWRRLKTLLRREGSGIILKAAKRLMGLSYGSVQERVLDRFFTDEDIDFQSLSRWCRRFSVDRFTVRSLNNNRAVSLIESMDPGVVVYGGGGILRPPFLEAADRCVLNAHSGPLPEIRGMNACEWSIMLGLTPKVTIHYIDEGIDTGAKLHEMRIPITQKDTLESLRGKCVVSGIRGFRHVISEWPDVEPEYPAEPTKARQCFVMAPVVKELARFQLKHLKCAIARNG